VFDLLPIYRNQRLVEQANKLFQTSSKDLKQ